MAGNDKTKSSAPLKIIPLGGLDGNGMRRPPRADYGHQNQCDGCDPSFLYETQPKGTNAYGR